MGTSKQLESLVELMARLRSPEGCPWDREQTFSSLGPMLIEEAYELLDAVEAGDWEELRDELGDMLFQLVFYAQLGAESGRFTIWDSIGRVHEKMVRRHPHVFGEEKVESTAEVLSNWEAIKAAERSAGAAQASAPASMLDGVSRRLPALLEAHQLTTKAARVGFDWPAVDQILEKLEEEVAELRAELRAHEVDQRRVDEEVGDILFVVANLARRVGTEPETGLRAANRKFRRRFGHIERRMAERGGEWREVTLATLDQFWEEAKRIERESPSVEGEKSLA
jgi:MazG family protein